MRKMAAPNFLRIINEGRLRIIAFDHPKKGNAIGPATYIGLAAAVNEAAADDTVAVLALTGVGEIFSSGNDLSALASTDDFEKSITEGMNNLRGVVHAFINFPKLFVAVVNGPSIGIAATVLALCDVVYASDKATFYTPFTALGLSAEGCSSYTFPRILGPSKAAEMLLGNHRMDAAEALRYGFVAEVFPHVELETKLWPRIRRLTELPVDSVVATKRLLNAPRIPKLLVQCEHEIDVLRGRFTTNEAAEALMKFMTRKSKL